MAFQGGRAQITLRHGGLDDDGLRAAGALAARAFSDDDLFRYQYPNDRRRARAVAYTHLRLLKMVEKVAIITSAYRDEQLVGVVVWIPPGAWPYAPSIQLKSASMALRAAGMARTVPFRGASMFGQILRHHPRSRHYYLQLVMVDPSVQRQGIGSQLLAEVLGRCDAERCDAHLETQRVDNVAYYERFGFTTTLEVTAPSGAAKMWAMHRHPTRGREAPSEAG